MEETRELPRPKPIDVNYLGELLRARMDAVGFNEGELEQELVPSLVFLYAFCIDFIREVNEIMDSSSDNYESLWKSGIAIQVGVTHMDETFWQFIREPLERFIDRMEQLERPKR